MYAYTGARLAAGVIKFEEVGPALDPAKVVIIPYSRAQVDEQAEYIVGGIPVLDPQYGNVWTNISREDFAKLRPAPKPGDRFEVDIGELTHEYAKATTNTDGAVYDPNLIDRILRTVVPYANSFGDVPVGQPLLYFNSLGNLSLAINEGDFAATSKVKSGPRWTVSVRRVPNP